MIAVVVILVAAVPSYLVLQNPAPASGTARCDRPVPLLPPIAVGPATHQGFSFGAQTPTEPTAGKTQDRLWYNDGAWWALMLDPSDNSVRIFELLADHSWRRTETVVDDRLESAADVRWDGTHLHVASAHPTEPVRVLRFSYSTSDRAYRIDPGFPVNATPHGTATVHMERDTTGRLWVAYVRAQRIWLAHSTIDQLTWTPPFVPALEGTELRSADVAALVSFNENVGLMWSNQLTDTFYFAIHADGEPPDEWSLERALSGAGMVDDHINMKSDSEGRIFAVVKTAQGDKGEPPDSPLTLVLARTADGSWSHRVFGTLEDAHSHHVAVIDEENRRLYVFATKGQDIVYKSTPLDELDFEPGAGSSFASFPGVWLDNATTSSHAVNADTGIVLLTSSLDDRRYYHAEMPLSSADAGATTPPELGTPIRFKAASTSAFGADRRLTIGLPAGVVAGDVLLASVDARGLPTIETPSGWDLVRSDVSGTEISKATFVRVATRDEPGSYSWDLPAATAAAGMMVAYAGVDAAGPVESASGEASWDSQLIRATSTQIRTPGARLVGLFASAGATAVTVPPNMLGRAVADLQLGEASITSRLADASCSATGLSGEMVAEVAPAGHGVGQLVVLRPSQDDDSEPTPVMSASPPGASPTIDSPASPGRHTPPPNIEFRSASASANQGETHIAVQRPAPVVAGDLMLASIDTRGSPEITPPFGWTLVRTDDSGNVMRKSTYYRVAESAEPGSYIWYLSRPVAAIGVVLVYAGVDANEPIGSSAGRGTEEASLVVSAPAAVAGSDDAMLVGLFGIGTLTPLTAPSAMEERVSLDNPSTENTVSTMAADALLSQVGEGAQLAATADRPARGVGQVIVLKPAR